MKWGKTHQSVANNNEAKAMYSVDAIGPQRATYFAKRLFEMRCRGWGDESDALAEVSDWSGLSPRSYKRLMTGETKDPSIRMFASVRAAYLNYCQKLVLRLQHEIEIEKEIHGDVAFADIGAEVEILARKIEAAKSRKTATEEVM